MLSQRLSGMHTKFVSEAISSFTNSQNDVQALQLGNKNIRIFDYLNL